MAVREVKLRLEIGLNPKAIFHVELEERFLQGEPNPEHVVELWRSFSRAVNQVLRKRQRDSWMIRRSTHAAVFSSVMWKLCQDFSRRTENLKVSFHSPKNVLEIVRLSAIPDDIRNNPHRWINAEIPTIPEEVEADLVRYADPAPATPGNQTATAVAAPALRGPNNSNEYQSEIQTATAELSGRYGASINTVVADLETLNPPIALQVYVVNDDESTTTSSIRLSALDRMKELESIKKFLAEEEYQTKRREILDSI